MSTFWLWVIEGTQLLVIYWSWKIISGMAETLLKLKGQTQRLSASLRNSNYELSCLKESIINTGMDFRAGKANTHIPIEQFSASLLNKLIQFCHPDKHNNDPKAGMLTAELIKIKHTRKM